jgi:hypothetical protein
MARGTSGTSFEFTSRPVVALPTVRALLGRLSVDAMFEDELPTNPRGAAEDGPVPLAYCCATSPVSAPRSTRFASGW